MMKYFSKTCCSNVANDGQFVPCNEPASYWYFHNDGACSFCKDHNCVCGERVYPPLEKLVLNFVTNSCDCVDVNIPFEYSSKESAIADLNVEIEKTKERIAKAQEGGQFHVNHFHWLSENFILSDLYFDGKYTYEIKTLDEWFEGNKIS